jgi:nucleotide-binding universal stress UspA family protein
MFNKILVAYDKSPESGRALLTGIHLAKSLNAELRAVSVQEKLPPYAGYIDAEVPGQSVLAIVPLDGIWVTADFKETQLKYMRPGQSVSISRGYVRSRLPRNGRQSSGRRRNAVQPPAA